MTDILYLSQASNIMKESTFKPKNIVVTGGNSGIGLETVKALYELGHQVIFGARNNAKNQEVVAEIKKQPGGSIMAFALDLSKRKSIEQFVEQVKNKFEYVDILVNNAGLMITGEKQVSELGAEMTLAVNHFGPFYLTYLLWGIIVKSSEARIINVSSMMHYQAPNNFLSDIECNNKNFSQWQQYNISKLFNVLFTRGINDIITKHSLTHVKTACLHPGFVDTNFAHQSKLIKFAKCCLCCMVINQETGARTSIYLCTTPFADIRSGEYYNDDTRWKEMDRKARNQENVKLLWQMSQKMFGVTFQ